MQAVFQIVYPPLHHMIQWVIYSESVIRIKTCICYIGVNTDCYYCSYLSFLLPSSSVGNIGVKSSEHMKYVVCIGILSHTNPLYFIVYDSLLSFLFYFSF